MTLPIDTVFVRHGQSESNLAKSLAEQGQHGLHEKYFADRHTRSFRLTKLGREQASQAGKWLREEFRYFDRFVVSEYARAMETAALLDLPGAEWRPNFYLTERDGGDLSRCPEEEREQRFREALEMREVEPFFWAPPNGESLHRLCLRLDRGVLDTLHRECSDKRVVLVCHGEVMWAYRVLLERMPQHEFRRLHLSKDPLDRLYNCDILHYTRRDPVSGKLAERANWMRHIRPTQPGVRVSDWVEIVRRRYSNEELLEIVAGYPAELE